MTKEQLKMKQDSLQKSLESLLQQQTQVAEQITMHRGAMQYNSMLIKELEDAEVSETMKSELKAVEV